MKSSGRDMWARRLAAVYIILIEVSSLQRGRGKQVAYIGNSLGCVAILAQAALHSAERA